MLLHFFFFPIVSIFYAVIFFGIPGDWYSMKEALPFVCFCPASDLCSLLTFFSSFVGVLRFSQDDVWRGGQDKGVLGSAVD